MTWTDPVHAVSTDRAMMYPAVLACPMVSTRPRLGRNWILRTQLERILDLLTDSGWVFLDLDGFMAAVEEPPIEPRRLLLTFDHCGPEFLEHAAPVVTAREIPSVLFVPTASVGRVSGKGLGPLRTRSRQLGWEQLRELSGRGVRTQPAGHHPLDLRNVSPEIAYGELIRSRREIERRLQQEASAFAYPYGSVDLQVADLAARAGFTLGFGNGKWPREAGLLNLSRVGLHATDRPSSVGARLGRAQRKAEGSRD